MLVCPHGELFHSINMLLLLKSTFERTYIKIDCNKMYKYSNFNTYRNRTTFAYGSRFCGPLRLKMQRQERSGPEESSRGENQGARMCSRA